MTSANAEIAHLFSVSADAGANSAAEVYPGYYRHEFAGYCANKIWRG